MSVASKKRLLAELKNKKYRDAYAAEHVKTMIPIQNRILREQRGWSQGQLAERMKTTQSVISRLEDHNYGKLSLSSLLKLASAYDVALLVKFVPFTRLLHEFEDASPDALAAKGFLEELSNLSAWATEDLAGGSSGTLLLAATTSISPVVMVQSTSGVSSLPREQGTSSDVRIRTVGEFPSTWMSKPPAVSLGNLDTLTIVEKNTAEDAQYGDAA